MNIKKKAFLLVFFAVLAFNLLYMSAPILAHLGFGLPSKIIYFFFSQYCHQLPERSFFFFWYKLAVCARCTGIYIGFLTATLLVPIGEKISKRSFPPIWLFFLALTPLALDGLTQLVGLRESTNTIRFLTGSFFGATTAFFLVPLVLDGIVLVWPEFKQLWKDLNIKKALLIKNTKIFGKKR